MQTALSQAGLRASVDRLPAGVGQAELEARVRVLSGAAAVDGIVVQLPLPAHIDAAAVLSAVEPSKDVDGFHPLNLGCALLLPAFLPVFDGAQQLAALCRGRRLILQGAAGSIVPCAALSCLELLKRSGIDLQGKTAAVLGAARFALPALLSASSPTLLNTLIWAQGTPALWACPLRWRCAAVASAC